MSVHPPSHVYSSLKYILCVFITSSYCLIPLSSRFYNFVVLSIAKYMWLLFRVVGCVGYFHVHVFVVFCFSCVGYCQIHSFFVLYFLLRWLLPNTHFCCVVYLAAFAFAMYINLFFHVLGYVAFCCC